MKVKAIAINKLPAPYVNLYKELSLFIEDPEKLEQKIKTVRDGEDLEDNIRSLLRVSVAIDDDEVKEELKEELEALSEALAQWMESVVLVQDLQDSFERLQKEDISSVNSFLKYLKDLRKLEKLLRKVESQVSDELEGDLRELSEFYHESLQKVKKFRKDYINPRIEYFEEQLNISDDPSTLREFDFSELNSDFIELGPLLSKETREKAKKLLGDYKSNQGAFRLLNLVQKQVRDLSDLDYIVSFDDYKKYRGIYNQYQKYLPKEVEDRVSDILTEYPRLKKSLGDPDFKTFLEKYLEEVDYTNQQNLGDIAVDWRRQKSGDTFELEPFNPNLSSVQVINQDHALDLVKEKLSKDRKFLDLYEINRKPVKNPGEVTKYVYNQEEIDNLFKELEEEAGPSFLIRKYLIRPYIKDYPNTKVIKTQNYFFLLIPR